MDSPPLLLVDAYAMIYRGYYAVRSLTTSKGVPSNAVFAFAKFITRLQKDHPSEDGAFVFDLGRPAHRMKLAPQYKANRPPMPEDLKAQLPAIRELIAASGWSIVEYDGYEADDLLAAIAVKFADRRVFIVSGDKDISQVIDGRVEMLVPDKDGSGLIRRGVKEVEEKFGVPPSRIVDYLALIGDSSDNIPGVNGVGPKTAAALIAEFGSAIELIARAKEVKKEALRTKIESSIEIIRTNIALTTLDTVPPQGSNWTAESFLRKTPDAGRLRAIATEYELRSVLKELDSQETPAVSAPPPSEPQQYTPDLFG